MKLREKIAYGIAGLLAFLPLSILVVVQSIFALEASYDSKIVIDANEITINGMYEYDLYGNDIDSIFEDIDEDGKLILWSIIEATDKYMILNLHGGKINNKQIDILGIQFWQDNEVKTEIASGIVYIKFKNVAMNEEDLNYVRDAWLRDFIEDINVEYKVHYEKPAGTISYMWLKVIAASLGTIIGILTVGLVILRKSTKALVKRYWRVAVLVALIEGTVILGFIAWIVTDIFQVFAAATVGWIIFLGAENIAKIKGYIDTPAMAEPVPELINIQADIQDIIAKYRR